MITVRKVSGGYAVFKDGKQWTLPASEIETRRKAAFMRQSKYSIL